MKAEDVTISQDKGRPVIARGGMPTSQNVYCDYIINGGWRGRVEDFIGSGTRIFHLRVPNGSRANSPDYYDEPFWTDDNVFAEDDTHLEWALDVQARSILERSPDACFYIKFLVAPPSAFARNRPDEIQTDEDGNTYRQASFSSPDFARQFSIGLEKIITYCEGRAWSGHILGYLGLPAGEGLNPLNVKGKMFDCSAANEAGFRLWVKQRYATELALRRAWRNDALTFDQVRVPRDRDWLVHRQNATPSLGGEPLDHSSLKSNCKTSQVGLFHWVEEADAPQVRDYCRFMRDAYIAFMQGVHRTAAHTFRRLNVKRVFGLDALKQPQIGWQIQSSFDGIGDGQSFPSMFVLTGSWGMEPLLDDKDLNLLWNPADYYARGVGFAWESEGLTDSMALRGKIAMVENDCRTYVGTGIQDQGAFRDKAEVLAGLLRNAAFPFSRGLHSYWCNVGTSYFHDKDVQEIIRQLVPMQDRLQAHPHRETRHAIAFVVDDESLLYEDFTSGYQTLALILQRIRGLSHCGVPYRIFLLSDLKQASMPSYKTWLFPNLFRVTPDVETLLKDKVFKDGNVAIFGPATGITDGEHLSAEGASRLLGVEMECLPRSPVRHVLIQDQGHAITRELSANMIYGDSMPYGPLLLPREGALEKTGAVALGHANTFWHQNRPGLFVKEFGNGAASNGIQGERGRGDYAVVFSVAMPLPADLLRACARYAGSHIWCEEDDVIYASDTMVAIHTAKAGPRTLNLPRRCNVMDAFSGNPASQEPASRLELHLDCPDTRIFMLQD